MSLHFGLVAELVANAAEVGRHVRERGEDDDDLIMAYESKRLGGSMPQGSIKAFRQYADYLSLCTPPIPVWPITRLKSSLFLLFRLLMGGALNADPLRDQYLRGLARSLEHFRSDTAPRFASRWPESGDAILRDGRAAPEGRLDLTHDVLRLCKLVRHSGVVESDSLGVDVERLKQLVCFGTEKLSANAWATRRRLSSRWVRDPESAKLPRRQYPGGKFVGRAPDPPVLSSRSARWNRHLHDLKRGASEEEGRAGRVSVGRIQEEDEDEGGAMEWDRDPRFFTPSTPTSVGAPSSSSVGPPSFRPDATSLAITLAPLVNAVALSTRIPSLRDLGIHPSQLDGRF